MQIGDGTDTNIHLPMAPYWSFSYSQVVYTADEIGVSEPQRLTKIAYKYNGNDNWSDHAKIFIGHTSLNDFTDTTWVGHDNLTLVYDGEFSVSNEEMWVEFQLSTPFLYNGTDNLIIAFLDDSDAIHGSGDHFYCTYAEAPRGLIYHNDYNNFDINNPAIPIETSYFVNIQMWFQEVQPGPQILLDTDSINFGQVVLGSVVLHNLQISNIGSETLEISDISCEGENNAYFTYTPANNISIGSGQSENIVVSYAATEEGEHHATLQITSNGGNAEVALEGNSIGTYVTTFPYHETFIDSNQDLPFGWMSPDNLWYVGTNGQDDDRCVGVKFQHQSGDAILVTPPFVLPASAQISFWWKNADVAAVRVAPYDSLFFEISNNGGQTWMSVDTLAPEMQLMAFEQVQRDLFEYAEDTVYFRWRHKTDNSYNAFGAGVDNISITYNEENNNSPTNLAATVDAYNVNLTWAIPEGDTTLLEGYNVYRDQAKINTNIITELQYIDTLANNGTYQYYVTAVYQNNESEPSNTVEVTITNDNTNPPTNLTATVELYNVNLTWEVPEGDTAALEGYNVYRNQAKINTDIITELQYIDTLTTNGTYQYYVTAVYQNNESEPGNMVEVTIAINNNPPTNLAATVDAYNVSLTWAIPEGDTTLLEGYNVYRDQAKINTNIITELQYIDTLANNGIYQYYVTAVYQNNESAPSNTVEVNIMVVPGITVSVSTISQEVEQNDTAQQSFTITNNGNATLSFNIELVETDSTKSRQGGDLITSFEVTNDMLPYAACFDNGNIWTSDVYVESLGKLFKLNQSGELIDSLNIDWAGSWIADVEATDDFLYMVEVDPSGDNGIKKVNKTTGELVTSITGEFSNDGSDVSQALAYDKVNDEFWIGGWFHDAIYHVDNQGNTISTISTTGKGFHDVTGLAWHPSGDNGKGSLFVVARNPYKIYELQAETGEVLQSFDTYNNVNMNGLSIDDNGNLWLASMTESSIYNIESGVDMGGNSSTPEWLTADMLSGELAPEATADIMLTFDADSLQVGTYYANIIINHNVPAQDSIVIPVTLQVEEQDGLASEEQLNLGVYPNPCSHVMYITAADNIKHIQVFNNQGQLVQSISSINDKMYKMDMSTLPKGMYIVECAIANKVIMKKIIKQ